MTLEKRRLGRIGFQSSIVTLGGCGVGMLNQEKADDAINLALQYGVNMVDVAPTYGEAELRLAPWVRSRREEFFIAEKTMQRTKEGVWNELQRSLKRLNVKHFDLYQLHGLGDFEELEGSLRKGGAIDAFTEAKETGVIKHIGITGHKDMRVLERAITQFEFDSVLLPVNLASMVHLRPANDFRPVLKEAAERDMAVIAIKALAQRRWKIGEKHYTTWYKPVDIKKDVESALWFTLSQEPVSTYSLLCDVSLWPLVLDAATVFKQLDEKELKTTLEHAKAAGFKPLFPTTVGEFSPV